MVVITDENHIVQTIACIPGSYQKPIGWHVYFPVNEDLPHNGAKFIPDLVKQPWLTGEVGTPAVLDDLETNVKYLLDRCPYTIRSCEGGGQEDLISSLCITFIGMQARLARTTPFNDWKHGDK